jgi:hypothetical protein
MNKQRLANVQNAVAGGICTIHIPPGPTYDAIQVRFAGATATEARIDNIRLFANGKTIQEFLDGSDLDDRNQYHGYDAMPGTPIDLYLPLRSMDVQAAGILSTVDAERLTSLRTGDLGPIMLQFQLDAAYVDASAANITAEAVVKPGEPEASGLMVFTRRTSYNPGGAGDFVINDIPRVGRVKCHHIIKADCTGVTVKRDRVAIWDNAQKTFIQDDQDQNGRVPAAGRTVIDFCANGNLDESVDLRGVADYELTLTLGSGGAFDILTEYVGTLGDF